MSPRPDSRLTTLFSVLERMAGGDLTQRLPISEQHDELDAICHAVNVLVGELEITTRAMRRAKEQAEAASLAKSVFLRNVSHEIRTPLTVILGLAELIASGLVPPGRLQDLRGRIESNGRALISLLDDLLDLAKVEASRIDFELQPVSLVEVVAEVLASFEPEAAPKSLRLVVESCEHAPRAMADPKRLRQALTNVIGNAVKFTARGQVAVRIGLSADGGQVLVDVADTGIGMTREQSRLLFEPFVQADTSIARRFGGSGLGLSLSKRFAEGMGGALDVLHSEPGVGTTFRLALPVAPTAAASVDPVPPPAGKPPRWGVELRGLRVLVAEDNQEVRATTAELLRSLGATVVEVSDGQEALERAGERSFDAILMDVRMPHLDGLEATRRLRAGGVMAPIVALTAYAVPEQEAECLAAGCSGYLPKPIDLARLVEQLGKDGSSGKPQR